MMIPVLIGVSLAIFTLMYFAPGDPADIFLGDVATQAENAMATIARALGEAGFSLADVVRVRYIVTDAAHAEPVFAVVGRWFADIRPAATMIVAGLIRPEMKVEIEATAFRAPPDR